MTAETTAPTLRIGEVAKLVGTTTRTIRYYEEIGLLTGGGEEREAGQHRLYADADVERLREALRLKALLGVSLDELKELLEVEEARGVLRDGVAPRQPGPRPPPRDPRPGARARRPPARAARRGAAPRSPSSSASCKSAGNACGPGWPSRTEAPDTSLTSHQTSFRNP